MNNTLHTPAPWAVRYTDNGLRIVYSDGEIRSHVADLHSMSLCEEHGSLRANANLIASAPDLLSALEWLAVWNDGEPCFCHVHGESERARYTPHDSYCDKARAAIAKAKGEA